MKPRESACVGEQGVGEGESRGDEEEGDEEDRPCARLVGQRAHRRVVESCTHKFLARRRLQSVRGWREESEEVRAPSLRRRRRSTCAGSRSRFHRPLKLSSLTLESNGLTLTGSRSRLQLHGPRLARLSAQPPLQPLHELLDEKRVDPREPRRREGLGAAVERLRLGQLGADRRLERVRADRVARGELRARRAGEEVRWARDGER